jgi:chaperonin GroES
MTEAPAFEPLADHILIRRDEAEAVTSGGLYIPEQAREAIDAGVALLCGPDALGVKPGERVLFKKYAATDLELEGRRFAVLREGDVLGVES